MLLDTALKRLRSSGNLNSKVKRRVYERFECAVITNNVKEMRTLLVEYPNLDLNHRLRRHADGNGFLHSAVCFRCADVLHMLLEECTARGQQHLVDQTNTMQETPLHLAIRTVQPQLVDLLLTARAANHVQTAVERQTPLLMALRLYIKYRDICSNSNSKAYVAERKQQDQYESDRRKLQSLSATVWSDDVPTVRRRDNELNLRLMRKILISLLDESEPSSWLLSDSKGQNVFQIALQHQVDFVIDCQRAIQSPPPAYRQFEKSPTLQAQQQQQPNLQPDINGNYVTLEAAYENGVNQENAFALCARAIAESTRGPSLSAKFE